MKQYTHKELYESPLVEVLCIETKSIVCQSFGTEDLQGFEFDEE